MDEDDEVDIQQGLLDVCRAALADEAARVGGDYHRLDFPEVRRQLLARLTEPEAKYLKMLEQHRHEPWTTETVAELRASGVWNAPDADVIH
jgi:hypothetical protein